ncbi:ABC transporter ATP-binding protein [bacterium]|jgi:energy-coupling factor transporter ATP-binding protein EcfA2|nr:ABC transporter ATP-binding protein [bacterium]
MIHSLKIKKLKGTNFNYVTEHEVSCNNFKINKTFNFKKGLNVIVGNNATGKSTLIKMLAEYTFSKDGISSLKNYDNGKYDFIPGIEVKNNFDICVFKTINILETDDDFKLNEFENFKKCYESLHISDGEKILLSIENVFNDMFNPLKSNFNKIDNFYNKKAYDQIITYISTHNIKEDENIYTVLMDEPDKNLDIHNINMMYNIFNNQKPNGQMIITLHNPLLIYMLTKLDNINFIELTPNYINEIKNLIVS